MVKPSMMAQTPDRILEASVDAPVATYWMLHRPGARTFPQIILARNPTCNLQFPCRSAP